MFEVEDDFQPLVRLEAIGRPNAGNEAGRPGGEIEQRFCAHRFGNLDADLGRAVRGCTRRRGNVVNIFRTDAKNHWLVEEGRDSTDDGIGNLEFQRQQFFVGFNE